MEAGHVYFSPKHASVFRFQPGLGKGQYFGEESTSSPGSLYRIPDTSYVGQSRFTLFPTLNCCSKGDILFPSTSEEDSLH